MLLAQQRETVFQFTVPHATALGFFDLHSLAGAILRT
jgi:hypothetical protein